MFSLRIVTVDYYQSAPLPGFDVSYSDFRGCEVKQVPVIRIFGITPKGQKACLHVHGVFPYISLPFDGGGYEKPEKFMQQLVLSIDKALNMTVGTNAHVQHVYKISLISGIPFYGYHEKEQQFLRIFFYNPFDIKKTVDLLQSGAIMNQIMQPYEAHIPYILQFFIDYNLYGMDMINICAIKFRKIHEGTSQNFFPLNELNSSLLIDNVQKLSSCELEMDCCAKDILNRQEAIDLPGMNPGLAVMWDEERKRQEIKGKTFQLTQPASKVRDHVEPTESELFFKNRLKSIIDQIMDHKEGDEDNTNLKGIYNEDNIDNEIFSSISASIVEIHNPNIVKDQKEIHEIETYDDKLIESQEHNKNFHSKNSLNDDDKKILEMIISMIDSQVLNSPEDVDSILNTQETAKDNEQEIDEYDDDLETLEMSQCIWDENICLDSNLIKEEKCNFSKSVYEEKVLDKFLKNSSTIHHDDDNCSTYSAKCSSCNFNDDFIIPQIDGTNDTLCQSHDDEKRNSKYPRRQISCNPTTTCFANPNLEGSWMQKTCTTNIPKKYDCSNGMFTPYNQQTYCAANNSHYTNYNKSTNQTGLLMCSQSLSSDVNWFSNPSNNFSNSPISYQSSTENNCMPFVPSYRITPILPDNTCSNEKTEAYRNSLNYSHINSSITSNYKEFEKTVPSSYKSEGNMKFSTIDTSANFKIFSKELVYGKNNNSQNNSIADPFDSLKTNIGKIAVPVYSHKFLTSKPKCKEVCNNSTQTNSGFVNNKFNQEKKIVCEKKSNPRTLVVQNMKRLQLSKRQAQQQTDIVNIKNLQEESVKNKKLQLSKNKVNIPFYPLIHRPAPELNLKMNLLCTNSENQLLKSNSTQINLSSLILPPYISKKDLAKIGKERVILKRLEKNYMNKNYNIYKNMHCTDNLKTPKQSVSALKMRLKMSRINTWHRVQELKNSSASELNLISASTKEDSFLQSSCLKNTLFSQNNNQETNFASNIPDKKKLPLKLTIKLPNVCPVKKNRIRKKRKKNYFKAFQPSCSHNILKLPDSKIDDSSTLAKSRSKRQNVNYHAHAYSHLLDFDKLVELPGDRRRMFISYKKKKTNDLLKQCKKLEIRLERLKPENIFKMNILVDKDNSSKLFEKINLETNCKEKILKNNIYQCVNVYPVSIDATSNVMTENYNPGNNDHSDEYSDVMWNLSYLSPTTVAQRRSSPPQCWSPNNDNFNNKNLKNTIIHSTLKNSSPNELENKNELSKKEEYENDSNSSSSISSKDDVDSDLNFTLLSDTHENSLNDLSESEDWNILKKDKNIHDQQKTVINDTISKSDNSNTINRKDKIIDINDKQNSILIDTISENKNLNIKIIKDKIANIDNQQEVVINDTILESEESNIIMREKKIVDSSDQQETVINDTILESEDSNLIKKDKIVDGSDQQEAVINDIILESEDSNIIMKKDKIIDGSDQQEAVINDIILESEDSNIIMKKDKIIDGSDQQEAVINDIILESEDSNIIMKKDKIIDGSDQQEAVINDIILESEDSNIIMKKDKIIDGSDQQEAVINDTILEFEDSNIIMKKDKISDINNQKKILSDTSESDQSDTLFRKIDDENQNNSEIKSLNDLTNNTINKILKPDIIETITTCSVAILSKSNLLENKSILFCSENNSNENMDKMYDQNVSYSIQQSNNFHKEIIQNRNSNSENKSESSNFDSLDDSVNSETLSNEVNRNVEDNCKISNQSENDKLKMKSKQDIIHNDNLKAFDSQENNETNIIKQIPNLIKEKVNIENLEYVNEDVNEEIINNSSVIDNSFSENDSKIDNEELSGEFTSSKTENEISSSNEIFSIENNDESIFLTQKSYLSNIEQEEISNSSFSTMDNVKNSLKKAPSNESSLNDLHLNLSESSTDSNVLDNNENKSDNLFILNSSDEKESNKFHNDEKLNILEKSSIDNINNNTINKKEKIDLIISEVKYHNTDIRFNNILKEPDKTDNHSIYETNDECPNNSLTSETCEFEKRNSFSLNSILDNVQYLNNVCTLEDCLHTNVTTPANNDIDLSPLSPEEKTIYDSDGNIVSTNTCGSQYSICLGDHNFSSENETQSFPEAINLHSSNILNSYVLMKSNISKSSLQNEKCLQISNDSQKVLSNSDCENNVIENDKYLNCENVNEEIISEFSTIKIKQQQIEEDAKSKHRELISKNSSIPADDKSLKDTCKQLCNQACLLHNNLLETQKTKNALLLGPFKEVSFVFPTQTEDNFYSDKNNISTFPELLKTSANENEVQDTNIPIKNEKLTCRMCYGTIKNNKTPVRIYHCKYCENIIQPISVKNEEILSKCTETNVTLKLIEPKLKGIQQINNCTVSSCESQQELNQNISLCNEETVQTETINDQIYKTLPESNNIDVEKSAINMKNQIDFTQGSDLINSESLKLDLRSSVESNLSITEDRYNENIIQSLTSEYPEVSLTHENSSVLSFYDDTVKINENSLSNIPNNQIKSKLLTPLCIPPTHKEIRETLSEYNIPEKKYQVAYYSNSLDVLNKIMEVGGDMLKIPTMKITELLEVEGKFQMTGLEKWQNDFLNKNCNNESSLCSSFSVYESIKQNPKLKVILSGNNSAILTPVQLPSKRKEVERWLSICKSNIKKVIQNEIEAEENPITLHTIQEISSFEKNCRKNSLFFLSTPKLGINNCRKRQRSNSWNESKIDNEKSLSKQRRLSGSFPPNYNRLRFKLNNKSPQISPIYCPFQNTNRENGKLSKKKRKLSVELNEFDSIGNTLSSDQPLQLKQEIRKSFLSEVKNQIISNHSSLSSDIEGPTLTNNFKVNFGNIQETNVNNQYQFLTVMSLEIHAETRGDLRPDPKYDSIKAIFYCINNDFPEDSDVPKELIGMIIVCSEQSLEIEDLEMHSVCNNNRSYLLNRKNLLERSGIITSNTTYVDDEKELMEKLIEVVRKELSEDDAKFQTFYRMTKITFRELVQIVSLFIQRQNSNIRESVSGEERIMIMLRWDPDIICGYEIQMLSWGYLIQRAAYLNINMHKSLSRIPGEKFEEYNYLLSQKEPVVDPVSELKIVGRIVLNVWKIMRKEVNLNIYTFENVVYHVLHLRIPQYSFRSLTYWFDYQTDLFRWLVIDYYITRVKNTMSLLNQLDIIGRTSTLARVFGIQFYEVLSRGTQFRVESMMIRMAKPENYIIVSPSIQQRAYSKAPECFALVLEPESKFYTSPIVVLDFQSLYPSMIIAYNYCYSTCLGRVEHLGNNIPFEFGCTSLNITSKLLKKLENDIIISPSGVAFVKHHIRFGILPKMLEDILNTRIMIKNAMNEYKKNKSLYKLLDARQLGLKLIANVTYGYTSANFSGRMPCVEIADSIVGKARETLEQAIKLIEMTTRWNAKVVYGDTDSIFVHLEGRSKEQAFKIGKEIADAVTAINPKPVKLKFEKVYLPCILQTKKRYVGYMYERPDQMEPIYDAKGIETIRRDSCPAVGKILEKSLKILFNTKDLSLVKKYVQKQFQKVLSGKVTLQDYIFAKEYRGRSGYAANACVPTLEIVKRITHIDPRAEPRIGERVPYVIVYGSPGLPLIQLVRQPQELLQDPGLKINSKYYIGRVILPPLHRAFSLIGVDVTKWYNDMPHPQNSLNNANLQNQCKGTLSQYFTSLNCAICNELTKNGICNNCKKDSQYVIFILNETIRKWERKFHHLSQICQTCTRTRNETNHCISLDCPNLFKLCLSNRDLSRVTYLRQLQNSLEF